MYSFLEQATIINLIPLTSIQLYAIIHCVNNMSNGSNLIFALRYQFYVSSVFLVFPIKRTNRNTLIKSNLLRTYSYIFLGIFCALSVIFIYDMTFDSSTRDYLFTKGYVIFATRLIDFIMSQITTINNVIQADRNAPHTEKLYKQIAEIDSKLNKLIKTNVNCDRVFWQTLLAIMYIN